MATKSTDEFDFISYKQEQVRLDGDAVKELLGRLKEAEKITESEYMECFKEISFSVYKVARKNPSEKIKFTPPELGNVTMEGIIDLLAVQREENAVGKKMEGYLKERLTAELIAAGLAEPSPPPPMPAWLKLKLEMGDDD